MRYLLILPCNGTGGTEQYVCRLAAAAAGRSWQVHVAFPQDADGTYLDLARQVQQAGATCHRLQISDAAAAQRDKRHYVLHVARTAALLTRIRPDLVHVNLPWPDRGLGAIAACHFLRVPLAITLHVVPPELAPAPGTHRVHRWAARGRCLWITGSHANRALALHHLALPPDRVQCIYNGIDGPQWQSQIPADRAASGRELLKELGLPAGARLVTCVARISSEKGYRELVQAIPHLTREFPEVFFVWAGDGGGAAELRALSARYQIQDRLRLIGYRRDVPRLLAASEIALLASHFEASAYALLEAMTAGTPLVASDATSIPEIVRPEVDGLLFRAGDACSLLEALRQALRDPARMRQLAQSAQERLPDFSQANTFRQTFAALESLLAP